ncbi:MAG: SDR family oxidoreductase [Gluconacetobacter diazotrophicus]|nr:SDR family oxidoreductase [Gluconacetobacter diazotrophicus]
MSDAPSPAPTAIPDARSRFRLDGRRALITGASRGIGIALCTTLSEAGADVVGVARDAAGLTEAGRAVEGNGRRFLPIVADLARAEEPERVGREAIERWGTIDVLVNNAGVSVPKLLVEQTIDEWDFIQAVNLRAPFLLARTLAPAMIAQKRGKIVNISSQTSAVALTEHGAYAASKNGLNGLTKVMTVEWGPHNIQANTVCPTVTWTPMAERVWGEPAKRDPMLAKIPAGRMAAVQEVCDVVLFLSAPASDMVNGQDLFVDGGYTAQ